MQHVCADLKAHRTEVMKIFEQLAAKRPWIRLPEDNKTDALPELIIRLVEASLSTPFPIESYRMQVKEAVQRGEARCRDGFSEYVLLEEYDLIRKAIWHYIRSNSGYDDGATDAIRRIDAAIDVATRASIYGYHSWQQDIDASKMDKAVERLLSSSPLLKPR